MEQHGNIGVKHLNTFSRAHYTVRMFSLKDTKAKKVILKKGFSKIVK